MAIYQGPFFDADYHYYEAHEAFTRHVPRRLRSRCVEWVAIFEKRKPVFTGR